MTNLYLAATANFATILDFLRFGISEANKADLYYGHGTDNAWDDILALILGCLSLPLQCDPSLFNARLTDDEKKILAEKLNERVIKKVPVPYLTNQAYFCELPFYVDKRVLIPRSPIAELINLQFTPWIEEDKVEKVLDLCTGSACIAIACAYAFPDATVHAVDISSEALEVAVLNRENHSLEDRLTLIQSDCWAEVPHVRYDIIVSNPPYVGEEEMLTLPQEYLHEPKLALETANNGLAIVKKILENAHNYLTEHGILIVEVGNTDEALIEAFPEVPFTWLDFEHGGHGVFLLTYQQLQTYFAPR